MSSSPYRRVTIEIENGNLAMVQGVPKNMGIQWRIVYRLCYEFTEFPCFLGDPVLATDIQYIGYNKGLRQVYFYSEIYGGLFTNIADILVESWRWVAAC